MKKDKLLDILMYIKNNEPGVNDIDITENSTVEKLCTTIKTFLEKNNRITK